MVDPMDERSETAAWVDALLDEYAYDHGASFHDAFGRTDDGYEEVES